MLRTEYSVFERAVEADVLPVVRELGIGFVPCSPLGHGFLTGAVKPAAEYCAHDMRSKDDRWQPGNYEKNLAMVRELTALAQSKGIAVTRLALAWLLARTTTSCPSPAPAARGVWKRTWPPRRSRSRPRTSPASRRSCRTDRPAPAARRG